MYYPNEYLNDVDLIERMLCIGENGNPKRSREKCEQNARQVEIKKARHLSSIENLKLVKKNKQPNYEIRNERERNRVRIVNQEFDKLKKLVLDSTFCRRKLSEQSMKSNTTFNDETELEERRVSKLRILQVATQYIDYLNNVLYDSENEFRSTEYCHVQNESYNDSFSQLNNTNQIDEFNTSQFPSDEDYDYLY